MVGLAERGAVPYYATVAERRAKGGSDKAAPESPRDKRGLVIVLGAAAAAGVYIEATRDRSPPAATAPPATSVALPTDAPRAAPTRKAVEEAVKRLERFVRPGASDPKNPWALAHGLVAFGKDLRTNDGRSAVEVIASFAEKRTARGRTVYRFPTKRDGIPVEPHRNLLLKTLLEVGVDPARELKASDGEPITLQQLADDLVETTAVPDAGAGWHHAAWTLGALQAHSGSAARRAHAALLTASLERLEADHRPVLDSERDRPERAFDPDQPMRRAKEGKTAIYGHSCGGLHFVQAVLEGVAEDATAERKRRAAAQVDALIYRYRSERLLYDSMLKKTPQHGLVLRVQKLKFFGHLLETLATARKLGIGDDRAVRKTAGEAAGDLLATLRDLDRGGVFQRLDTIRREQSQTYLDLIGDGCHAIRGLRGTLDALER